MNPPIQVCKSDLILFTIQCALIFVVVCVSFMNLTMGWGNLNLWTVELTSSLAYIMPNPKIKISNGSATENRDKSIKRVELQ